MSSSYDLPWRILVWMLLCSSVKATLNSKINENLPTSNHKSNNKLLVSCSNISKLNGCNNLNLQTFSQQRLDTTPAATYNSEDDQLLTNKLTLTSSGYISDRSNYKFTPLELAEQRYLDKIQKEKLLFNRLFLNHTKQENEKSEAVVETSLPILDQSKNVFKNLNQNFSSNDNLVPPLSLISSFNVTPLKNNQKFLQDIYDFENGKELNEKIHQINLWLINKSPLKTLFEIHNQKTLQKLNQTKKNYQNLKVVETKVNLDYQDYEDNLNQDLINKKEKIEKTEPNTNNEENDNMEKNEQSYSSHQFVMSGTSKTPPCATTGRFYCSYKEDYPYKVVTEITKYYKWPLEKLFRDLRQQVMLKLANDNYGALVCDSITRVIRPGWARNTANKWLVVINNEHYQQYITEIICRHGAEAQCNFIPPCYQATCKQRFNTQKLLVIDPWNPYKGPFLSEFLFASCCVCYIPEYSPNNYILATNLKSTFIKKEE